MKYLIILCLMSFSAFAGDDLEPFTLNQTIEGYNISLNCDEGKCKGKASKFIFSKNFDATYKRVANYAIVSIDDSIKATLNINLITGVYTYDWNKK